MTVFYVLARVLVAFMLAPVLILSALLGFWVADHALPVSSVVTETLTPTVMPGKLLLVRVRVDRHDLCAAQKIEFIFDSQGMRWQLPVMDVALPQGNLGVDEFVTATPVPVVLPPGPARMRRVLAYICNPVDRIWPRVDILPDIPFTVGERRD